MRASIFAAACLAILVIAGCGSGSDSNSSSTTAMASEEVDYPEGPTREFFIPGGDNTVQLYGEEGTKSEREEASRVIQAWIKARAAGRWSDFCQRVTRATVKEVLETAKVMSEGKDMACPEGAAFAFAATKRSRKNTLPGPIDSLRVGDSHSYAQYHGNDGKDWIVVVEKEGGDWKVSGMDPLDRLK